MPYLLFFEFGAIFTFGLIMAKEWRNWETLENILLAAFYGVLLEIINVYSSRSYSYSSDFTLSIYNIPIAIGMGWAIIYYCAEKMAEAYRLKWWQSPLLMAIIALSLDLSIDAVAIRLGFWHWRILLNQEWFGVPYDNLVGWLAVVWTFAFLANLSRQNFFNKKISKLIKYSAAIVSPFLLSLQITIYVALSAIFSERFSAGDILSFYRHWDFSYAYYPDVQRYKAILFFALVFAVVAYLSKIIRKSLAVSGRIEAPVHWFSFWIFTVIHLGVLAVIFISGIYRQIPAMVLVSVLMLFFHFGISLFPHYWEKI